MTIELTRANVIHHTNKENTLAFLRSLPEATAFAPNNACDCMYHMMFVEQFGVANPFVNFNRISCPGTLAYSIDGTFAERFQMASVDFLYEREGFNPEGDDILEDETITRDEAIAIAERVD